MPKHTRSSFVDEFPLDSGLVHLNHAGVGPWPRRTAEALQRFTQENLRSGSERYAQWMAIEQDLRERLCRLINADSSEDIALLKSTSEGLSVVAYGLDWRAGDKIVTAAQEFPSNRVVWESLQARFGVQTHCVDLHGTQSPEQALIDALDENTRLLAVSAVQYASGLRMDLERLGAACREREILFCVDAIQMLGAAPFDLKRCQADFVAADGHKWMLAPEGVALFYCRPGLRESLKLNQFGWHMVEDYGDFDRRDWTPAHSARRFECGSPNSLGVHGLHASLGLLEEVGITHINEIISGNTSYLIDNLKELGCEIMSPVDPARRLGIVVFRHSRLDSEALYQTLMKARVLCALRGGGVRFSPHFHTSEAQLDQAVKTVKYALDQAL